MMVRIPSLVLVAAVLFAVAGLSLHAAGDQVHEATVVKAGEGKITLTFKGDEQKHTHDVAKDAKITLDAKKAKLEDLKEGFPVRATTDAKFVITTIVLGLAMGPEWRSPDYARVEAGKRLLTLP